MGLKVKITSAVTYIVVWLVVSTPPKNMKVSYRMIVPNIWKKSKPRSKPPTRKNRWISRRTSKQMENIEKAWIGLEFRRVYSHFTFPFCGGCQKWLVIIWWIQQTNGASQIGVELQHMIAYVKCVSKKYHLTKQRRGQPKIMYLKIHRFFLTSKHGIISHANISSSVRLSNTNYSLNEPKTESWQRKVSHDMTLVN